MNILLLIILILILAGTFHYSPSWGPYLWSFRGKQPKIIYPFRSLTAALREKDLTLYQSLCHLSPSTFRVEWNKVYPEDFPDGGLSRPDASSVMPKTQDRI